MTSADTGTAPEDPAGSYTAEDYPGKVTKFLDDNATLVLSIIGFQSLDADTAVRRRGELVRLLDGDFRPDAVEHARHFDAAGFEGRLSFLYWRTDEQYEGWWNRPEVRSWWENLPLDGPDGGTWRETMATTAGRHQYATGQKAPAGPSAFLPLTPSPHFGFQGAYRARMADSSFDRLGNDIRELPEPRPADSLGRRLTVSLPENVCFIREGQTWDDCSEAELQVWQRQMNPVIGSWVSELERNPVGTGCISIRDCIEQDGGGKDLERRSEIAFLLSLGHIEKAARKNPSHLALMNAFTSMYAEATFDPTMNIWVEVQIPHTGKLEAEYINCHGLTGFLPFFESRPALPAPRRRHAVPQ
ncbi:phenylacetaldoxime dehydratase family protein [Arthrobacter zhaoguopingii]|uniref:phenylacetaldoxime dehydratase family protein n=1 Tax=Arthrobacter zhaoguopingii TaxID=2681491 RepID=UPI00135C96A2|nr:phenylacetaldoxime dehydratase family protein [Arthrobacter zhaoguopingii]